MVSSKLVVRVELKGGCLYLLAAKLDVSNATEEGYGGGLTVAPGWGP